MTRRLLRWPGPESRSLPRHPYRDTAILHGVLAALVVVIAWASGSAAGRALVIAAAYFVAATLWSWWRFRERARRPETSTEEEGQQ